MYMYDEDNMDDVNEARLNRLTDHHKRLLRLNPEYPYWSGSEENGAADGWPVGGLCTDDWNELVHFKFDIGRGTCVCDKCDGSGLNEATKKISDSWYGTPGWCCNLTEDEVNALRDNGRLGDVADAINGGEHRYYYDRDTKAWMLRVGRDGSAPVDDDFKAPTPSLVNQYYRNNAFHHDSINHWICTEVRAKRMGVWGVCEVCQGDGYVFTTDKPTISLHLWIAHPRRTVTITRTIKNIADDDIPKVIEYLQKARDQVAKKFSKLPEGDAAWDVR